MTHKLELNEPDLRGILMAYVRNKFPELAKDKQIVLEFTYNGDHQVMTTVVFKEQEPRIDEYR